MKVIGRADVFDTRGGRTLYAVQLGDGREVNVMRKHLTGLVYVMEPCPDDIDERYVLAFLRRSEYAVDFSCPVWERRRRYSYAPVRDACYSPEQAFILADECWKGDKHRDSYVLFRIRVGNAILKDYLVS